MFRIISHRLRRLVEFSRRVPCVPTHVRRLERPDDCLSGEVTLVERLSSGDYILCVAGEVIPCGGTVVDGLAAVCQSGASPSSADSEHEVIRGGSPVHPGTTVMTNFLIVRVGYESPNQFGPSSVRPESRRRVKRSEWT